MAVAAGFLPGDWVRGSRSVSCNRKLAMHSNHLCILKLCREMQSKPRHRVLIAPMDDVQGFFVPYLTGGISIAVLAVGSTAPGLLQFFIDK